MAEASIGRLDRRVGRTPAPRGGLGSRLLDICLALAALLFVLPLLIGIIVAMWILDKGPVFFSQARVGLGGRDFACLKFRTMAVDAEARLSAVLATSAIARREWDEYRKLTFDPRITRLGRFLRSSSLDELPQLFNVLWGDMSLVGPRPIVQAEASRYGRYFRSYCSVRPGITGLWQVLGRNRVSYRRRVAMDVLYVRNRSLWLNVKILLATVPAVLMRKGAV